MSTSSSHNDKPEWTRLLEQIGALTVIMDDTPGMTMGSPWELLNAVRQELIERIQADREAKQTAERLAAAA